MQDVCETYLGRNILDTLDSDPLLALVALPFHQFGLLELPRVLSGRRAEGERGRERPTGGRRDACDKSERRRDPNEGVITMRILHMIATAS